MARIIIAFLFVFAVVTQSASLSVNQGGIRLPAVAAQPSKLTEYADCDDADHNFFIATIVLATPALERLGQLALGQNTHRTQRSDRDRVPLYDLHAAWRI